MKLTILGSGTFFVSPSRTASSFLLDTVDQRILVDCGPGTLYRLAELNIPLESIDTVLVTHFHPDHTSDLFPFFMNFRLVDLLPSEKPQKYPQIIGPVGIAQFMEDMANLTELKSVTGWGKIPFVDYADTIRLAPQTTLKSFSVVHAAFKSPAHAYSLRIESEGKTVTFSGDTALCDGIKNACYKSDLFICDASFPTGSVGLANPVHLEAREIGEVSQSAGVKKVMLTHFYPAYSNIDLVAQVKEFFAGEVANCADKMIVEI